MFELALTISFITIPIAFIGLLILLGLTLRCRMHLFFKIFLLIGLSPIAFTLFKPHLPLLGSQNWFALAMAAFATLYPFSRMDFNGHAKNTYIAIAVLLMFLYFCVTSVPFLMEPINEFGMYGNKMQNFLSDP